MFTARGAARILESGCVIANEFLLNGSIAYSDSEGSDFALSIADLKASITTKKFIHHKQNIGITEEALDLGELTSLGLAMFINWDTTNFAEIRTATGSTKFAKVKAGRFAIFEFGSGVTAPFAIADTAAVQLEYCIWAP